MAMKSRDYFLSEAKNNSWSHAYLMIGNNDILQQEIINFIIKENKICKEDIFEIEPDQNAGKAGDIKIESIRELLSKISLSSYGKIKLAVIKSCQKLNASSGNILLKSLEEPPGKIIFILLAAKDRIIPTIKSRCRVIHLEDKKEGAVLKKYIPELKKGFFAASTIIESAVKNNEVEFLLLEIRNSLREKLLVTKNKDLAEGLRLVEDAEKKIEQNGNQKLILECLALSLEGII